LNGTSSYQEAQAKCRSISSIPGLNEMIKLHRILNSSFHFDSRWN
jgi:hypothetical protein